MNATRPMTAPPSGVKIRMYRQGHGDCFLLAFPGKSGNKKRPVYMLIDCGLKPKSEIKNQKIEEIVGDIAAATEGFIDIVVVTHEHQDHVNGFISQVASGGKAFEPIRIGEVWLAWTEDGEDKLANQLRSRFNDTLVALAFAGQAVNTKAVSPVDLARAERIADLLELETGDEGGASELVRRVKELRLAVPDLEPSASTSLAIEGSQDSPPRYPGVAALAVAIGGITNKRAVKYLRDKAEKGVTAFLRPDRGPYKVPDVAGLKVFALGPPRDVELLLDLEPRKDEEFKLAGRRAGFALSGPGRTLLSAFEGAELAPNERSPFSNRYIIRDDAVFNTPLPAEHPLDGPNAGEPVSPSLFYRAVYGGAGGGSFPNPTTGENEDWRRIDNDWHQPAEVLALRLNQEVNNTSLVLALELPKSKRVLLFAGDAQRGNWISWAKLSWQVGGERVTSRDLLSRCVFYKVGHHGSHNATLNGASDDPFPNLGWMAQGDFAGDFVAMIPANSDWARNKPRPWLHPMPAIESALREKARGRVFRSDIDQIAKPAALSSNEWATFKKRRVEKDRYFEYTVLDR